jgi:hypothetical protein
MNTPLQAKLFLIFAAAFAVGIVIFILSLGGFMIHLGSLLLGAGIVVVAYVGFWAAKALYNKLTGAK